MKFLFFFDTEKWLTDFEFEKGKRYALFNI